MLYFRFGPFAWILEYEQTARIAFIKYVLYVCALCIMHDIQQYTRDYDFYFI